MYAPGAGLRMSIERAAKVERMREYEAYLERVSRSRLRLTLKLSSTSSGNGPAAINMNRGQL